MTDLWSEIMSLTLATLNICQMIDEKMQKHGTLPKEFNLALMASASQLKMVSTKLSQRACYECANLMGGAGVCDNTLMHDLLGISRIQEIGGGTRQIQQYILSMGLRQLFKAL